ncbi:MAG: guanylate kinase [Clostridiales bacterium]|nr:guanylate kinase [Clostridiales bacterium]
MDTIPVAKREGVLVVLSGPSGVGKNTVLNVVAKLDSNILLGISATTRTPRPGETDGVNYLFKTKKEFERMIINDELFEFAEYNGNYYGSPKQEVQNWIAMGNAAIIEIEVQGANKVREKYPEAIFIFLAPPSMKALITRLRGRNTESEDKIQARYKTACYEITQAYHYDYIVINDDIREAASEVVQIVHSELMRVKRNKSTIDFFIEETKQDCKE